MAFNNSLLMHHTVFVDPEAATRTDEEEYSYVDDFLTAIQTYQMEFDAENISSITTDEEDHSDVDDFLTAIQTYQMEFDVENPKGKLPGCFSREYGNIIDSFVVLRDPNLNEHEVHVARKSNKLYFDKGWSDLKHVYDLGFGGWVTLGYVNPKFLTIRIRSRPGVEVKYPTHSPPLKRLLDRTEFENSPPSYVLRPSFTVSIPDSSFVRTFVKQVTQYDIDSGTLILPWRGFGEYAFTFGYSDLVLVDCLGERYQCKVTIGVGAEGEYACKVSGGWVDLCTVHGVVEGRRVGFCVTYPVRGYVLYVTAYPQMGIQSMLSYPLSNGSQVPFYVSQHYFLS